MFHLFFFARKILAKKLDLATVFLKVTKVKRGYYQAEFIPINDKGSTAGEHEITEKFHRQDQIL